MKKCISICSLLLMVMLLPSCHNMESKQEDITINGRTYWVMDDTTIQLKKGYWVEDYDIDYDNNKVVLYMYKEEVE